MDDTDRSCAAFHWPHWGEVQRALYKEGKDYFKFEVTILNCLDEGVKKTVKKRQPDQTICEHFDPFFSF